MFKILQRLKTLKIYKMPTAEYPEKNHTSLAGLDQNLLFFGPPYISETLNKVANLFFESLFIILAQHHRR